MSGAYVIVGSKLGCSACGSFTPPERTAALADAGELMQQTASTASAQPATRRLLILIVPPSSACVRGRSVATGRATVHPRTTRSPGPRAGDRAARTAAADRAIRSALLT